MSDSQRESAAARNINITTGTTGAHTIVYAAPDGVIDEERDSEGETEYLGDEANVHAIEREGKYVVKTVENE